MGGRGANTPGIRGRRISSGNFQNNSNKSSGLFNAGEGNSTPGWDGDGNQALIKWQNQTDDDKSARYLAKLGKAQTPSSDAQGYSYHQNAFQNMVIDMGLDGQATALSKSDFKKYVTATNQSIIYRGTNPTSKDKFMNAVKTHTGTGMYGDGLYFGTKQTAAGYYQGAYIKAALSTKARVVDVTTVRQAISKKPSKFQKALKHSGLTKSSSYAPNSGEAQMALKMGYNVIRTSWNYVVLDRSALVYEK